MTPASGLASPGATPGNSGAVKNGAKTPSCIIKHTVYIAKGLHLAATALFFTLQFFPHPDALAQ